jgi:hypothetical protein
LARQSWLAVKLGYNSADIMTERQAQCYHAE